MKSKNFSNEIVWGQDGSLGAIAPVPFLATCSGIRSRHQFNFIILALHAKKQVMRGQCKSIFTLNIFICHKNTQNSIFALMQFIQIASHSHPLYKIETGPGCPGSCAMLRTLTLLGLLMTMEFILNMGVT